jgi:hypothetical protein
MPDKTDDSAAAQAADNKRRKAPQVLDAREREQREKEIEKGRSEMKNWIPWAVVAVLALALFGSCSNRDGSLQFKLQSLIKFGDSDDRHLDDRKVVRDEYDDAEDAVPVPHEVKRGGRDKRELIFNKRTSKPASMTAVEFCHSKGGKVVEDRSSCRERPDGRGIRCQKKCSK